MKTHVHVAKWSELTDSQKERLNFLAAAGKIKTGEDVLATLLAVGAFRG